MPDDARMIDCKAAMTRLWDYLDGELDDERVGEVRHHLELCEHCFQNADFSRRFLESVSGVRGRQALPSAVRLQVMSALTQAGFPSAWAV